MNNLFLHLFYTFMLRFKHLIENYANFWYNIGERDNRYYKRLYLFLWEGVAKLSIYETLTLMISFGILIATIMSNRK